MAMGRKLLALGMLFAGGLSAYTFVWDLGDLGVGLMTVFNILMILPMSREALDSLREYEGLRLPRRRGKDAASGRRESL